MSVKPFPPISKELMEALEAHFPDVCPGLNDSDETVKTKIAQVAVIRFIRDKYDRQNKTVIKRT